MNESQEFNLESFLAGLAVGRLLWSPLLVDPDELAQNVLNLMGIQESEESPE